MFRAWNTMEHYNRATSTSSLKKKIVKTCFHYSAVLLIFIAIVSLSHLGTHFELPGLKCMLSR